MNCVFNFVVRSNAVKLQSALLSTTQFETSKVIQSAIKRNISLLPCSCVFSNSRTSSHPPVRYKSNISTARGINMSAAERDAAMSVMNEENAVSVTEVNGWLNIGQYNVFAWSVSGVESCIVVKSDDLSPIAFDMGIAVPESIKASHVFITHGHPDHIGAVTNHASKRSMFGMKPACYHVPPHLVDNLRTVTTASSLMAETHECLKNVTIKPFEEGEIFRLSHNYFVKTFPTQHRIPSQGFIVYKEDKKLKEQYKGLEGFEVAALYRQGAEIHDVHLTPEVAYTGDTVFDLFLNPPNPDLLKVKLLITEATFLSEEMGKNMVDKARQRGHIHLYEFAANEELFKDVGHIVLVHFSNRYPVKYIQDCLRDRLPPSLRNKVTPGVLAKALMNRDR